jgi:phosphate:Na+ symporter
MEISLITMIAPLLAGLGLFFCGIHFVSANLTPLAGKRFRAGLARATTTRLLGACAGVVAGIVTQSTNAVTYVTISLVSAGVIEKRRALPIPLWSHVGASLLVLLVAVDLRIGASYIVALAGFAIYFGINRADRARHVIAIFLGIGLLFMGIEMLKSGAVPLRDLMIQEGLVAAAARSPAVLLLLGAALTVVSQSSTVTGAVAVTATSMGLLGFEGACLLVYGANLGSGINHIFLARSFTGDGRQMALMQTAQKCAGFLVMLAIIVVEHVTGRAVLNPAVQIFTAVPSGQVAWVFLFYQVAGSTICTLLMGPLITVLERLAPPSKLELLGKPAYLSNEALFEPSLALDLAAREERRLLERLPMMLDEVRADGDANGLGAETLRTAGVAVAHAMSDYLSAIMDAGPDRSDVGALVRLQHRTLNLSGLFDAISEFVAVVRKSRQWPSSGNVADQMVEALHALLGALVDATLSEDATEQHFILTMLGGRDEMMDRMRRRVLQENPDLPADAQEALFAATMLFERIVWLARRSALLILPEAESDRSSA